MMKNGSTTIRYRTTGRHPLERYLLEGLGRFMTHVLVESSVEDGPGSHSTSFCTQMLSYWQLNLPPLIT